MLTKAFRDWKFEEVQRTFGIRRLFDYPPLDKLLDTYHEPIPQTKAILEELRQELLYTIDTLNEEELKVYFIGPLLRLIPFRTGERRPFLDRPMTFSYGGVSTPVMPDRDVQETGGKVDWMLAEGIQDPRQPYYFFIHEYKKEIDASGDPLGQLLIAMMGARQLNEGVFPLYGCYVLGRNWFFVVLDNDQYAVSDALVATQEDIFRVYSVLEEIRRRTAALAV